MLGVYQTQGIMASLPLRSSLQPFQSNDTAKCPSAWGKCRESTNPIINMGCGAYDTTGIPEPPQAEAPTKSRPPTNPMLVMRVRLHIKRKIHTDYSTDHALILRQAFSQRRCVQPNSVYIQQHNYLAWLGMLACLFGLRSYPGQWEHSLRDRPRRKLQFRPLARLLGE